MHRVVRWLLFYSPRFLSFLRTTKHAQESPTSAGDLAPSGEKRKGLDGPDDPADLTLNNTDDLNAPDDPTPNIKRPCHRCAY